MADFLSTRTKSENTILEAQFIRMKLKEMADDIDSEQKKRIGTFRSEFWKERTFSVTDNVMNMQHLKVHRFIDMKTITLKDGTKKKKKFYPIYNRVVMGQYNQLTKELAYGFTEEIKNSLRKIQ